MSDEPIWSLCESCQDRLDSVPTIKPPAGDASYNVALWRLVKGHGSIMANLAKITGLSQDGLKARVKRIEHDARPEDIEPADQMDAADLRYFSKTYARSTDPAVREWLASINAPTRSRPDWRRSSDRVGTVGKSKRVVEGHDDDAGYGPSDHGDIDD